MGSWSIKIAALLRRIKALKRARPEEKALVFSKVRWGCWPCMCVFLLWHKRGHGSCLLEASSLGKGLKKTNPPPQPYHQRSAHALPRNPGALLPPCARPAVREGSEPGGQGAGHKRGALRAPHGRQAGAPSKEFLSRRVCRREGGCVGQAWPSCLHEQAQPFRIVHDVA